MQDNNDNGVKTTKKSKNAIGRQESYKSSQKKKKTIVITNVYVKKGLIE